MIVAKQVAKSMDGQTFEFPVQAGAACAAAGGLDRDHDVAEKNPIARRIRLALQLLHMETQDVGGPIEAAELAIECANLVIIGQQQGG